MKLKTYLVEDSPTIRDNLIATLEELTDVTNVGTAETQAEGAAWLIDSNNAWDLAVVDLFLKQGTGFGVLSACKNRLPNQKVIVLSNYATRDVRDRCSLLGADAVFDKSTEIDKLIEFCANLANQQG